VMDVAYKGSDGEYLAHINEYDLIILDYVLPDTNGLELCLKLRRANIRVPILFVTVRYGIRDKVAALDAGADDYIVKPFSVKELHARIRALMRRSSNVYNDDVLKAGDLLLDVLNRKVVRNDMNIYLRRKEFNLLEYMLRNQNRVLTRGMILEHVWEDGIEELSNTVDVHIKYLRDKVDKPFNEKLIKTVHGLGYKLENDRDS
ncbi:response regulator transcription factor, partial [Candidatus Woesebacteria bacterium]|nr:response regulator transcription factor [Candidatus Woesebacteria bacterium]